MMGELVSVIASTHNPRICWNRDQADPDDFKRMEESFGKLRKALADAKSDVLIMIANDHLDNFFFDNQPTYTIGTGAVAEGPFWYEDEIMHLPRYKAHVDQDLARYIMRRAVEEELPVSQSEEFRIDHAFTLPLSYFRPEQDLPIVPIITNAFGYPIPENYGWYRLGQFLKKIVDERPAGERIAIACSFNMTVDVGGPKMGKYNKEFSDNMLAMMREGALAEMLEKLTIKNLVAQGNSTAEFLNYFAILGVVEDRPPTYIEHKPVKGVGTCPVVMWDMN